MMKLTFLRPEALSFLALCLLNAIPSSAQTTEPWLGLVPEVEHTEGELEGMTTYRLYLYTPSADDFLVLCGGWDENPMVLESTASPAWYQSEFAASPLSTGVNSAFFAIEPELEYDSWFTVGWTPESTEPTLQITTLPDPGVLTLDTLYQIDTLYQADTVVFDTLGFSVDTLAYTPPYDMFAEFDLGNNLNAMGPIGNAWFILPTLTNTAAFAGDDLRICVAQLTTAGDISGQMFVSVRQNFTAPGVFENFESVLPIHVACDDPEASNYDPESFSSDGCIYQEVAVDDLRISESLKVYPTPASNMVAVVFPPSASREWSSCTLTVTALDGRSVGSWNAQGRQTQLDVSDLPSGQYILSVQNADGDPTVHRTTLLVAH